MTIIISIITGICFGLGLGLSHMIDPQKILNFLDVTGTWDPSLMLVMVSGVLVTAFCYALIFKRQRPFFSPAFYLPHDEGVDLRLFIGSGIFGIGWGMTGLCPGPAWGVLVYGHPKAFLFVTFMILGWVLIHLLSRFLKKPL